MTNVNEDASLLPMDDVVVNYKILYELNLIAQRVTNSTFVYFMTIGLVALKHLSKIDLEASFGEVNGNFTTFSNENGTFIKLTEENGASTNFPIANLTSSFVFDKETIPPFYFTFGTAAYGALVWFLVWISAHRNPGSDFDGSKVMKLYRWTSFVPIISPFLELPIAFNLDVWMTLFLWTGYLIAVAALFMGMYWKGNYEATGEEIGKVFGSKGGSDATLFLCINLYTAYLLLGVISGSSQYFVLRKSQREYDEKKKEGGEEEEDSSGGHSSVNKNEMKEDEEKKRGKDEESSEGHSGVRKNNNKEDNEKKHRNEDDSSEVHSSMSENNNEEDEKKKHGNEEDSSEKHSSLREINL